MRPHALKIHILGPLAIVLAALVAVFIWQGYSFHHAQLLNEAQTQSSEIKQFMDNDLEEHIATLQLALYFVQKDRALQTAWLTNNRQALLEESLPIFEGLNREHGGTHFYYHNLKGINYLRVHTPDKYGDTIDRFSLRQTMTTGQPAGGLELGAMGTFTLRVVQPWIIEGRLSGYLELAREIDHIVRDIKKLHGCDYIVTIKKDLLSRSAWEDGQHLSGRSAQWDRFPQIVIAGSSWSEVPDEFIGFMHERPAGEGWADIRFHDRRYRVNYLPLYDISGKQVGEVMFTFDLTERYNIFWRSVRVVSVASVCMGLALFLFFYAIIQAAERKLLDAQEQLVRQSRVRQDEQARYIEAIRREQEATQKVLQERKAILDGLKDVIVEYVDPRMNIIWSNRVTVDTHDRSDTLCEGRRCFEILHDRRDPCPDCTAVKAFQTGCCEEGETTTPDGQTFLMRSNPLKDAQGQCLGVVHAAINITEQKQREEQLKRFRAALDSSADALFIIDRKQMRFVDVNRTAAESTGYTIDELLHMGPQDIKPLFTPEQLAARFDEIIQSDALSGTIETVHQRKDGTQFPVEVSLRPITLGDNLLLIASARDISERIRSEQQRRESEEKFRAIGTAALDAVVLMDPAGRISFWNQAAARMFGYSAEEALHQNLHALLAPEPYREAHQARFECFLETGEGPAMNNIVELEAIRKDGMVFPVELSVSPIQLHGKWHAVGIVRDITERKRNELTREHMLHEMRERVKELTCLYEVNRMVREADDIEEMLRRTAEIIPNGWQYPEITRVVVGYHECDYTAIPFEKTTWKQVSDIVVHGSKEGYIEVYYLEERPIADDGPFQKEEQQLLESIAYTLGVSIEQKRGEKDMASALEEARHREAEITALLKAARAVLENRDLVKSARVIFNVGRDIIGASAGYVALLNKDKEENEVLFLEPGGLSCTVDPSLPMPVRGLRGQAYATGRAVYDNDFMNSPWIKFLPAGHVRVDNVLFAPLIVEGETVGLMGMANKPGGFTENDARLASAFAELAAIALINSRTLEALAASEEKLREGNDILVDMLKREKRISSQLEAANEKAEAATAAKSAFLANMSHEIRTPMTAILGFADMMLEPNLSDSERLNAVHIIRRNGEHLLQVINDILDLSKIESGKLDVERITCPVAQILADVESLMRVRASGKGLALTTEVVGPIPETIHTDPTRLRQILLNLLGNAIKFTEQGGVRLVATLLQPAENGNNSSESMIQFQVIDTGIGISDTQMERLFRPFEQADISTSRRFGGSGLGLVISKRLAEQLGGTIAVTSVLGQGSCFAVTVATGSLEGVPMLEGTDIIHAAQLSSDERGDENNQIIKARILLAEDGPDNQRLLRHMLQRTGAEVSVVDNGRAAVDLALEAVNQGHPFDIILMDMQMPIMDGYEAAELLREKGYEGLIIALTAHAMASDREKCIRAGCDDFASKPIHRKVLIETVRKNMARVCSVS